MKILVTGADGFVGSNFIVYLCKNNTKNKDKIIACVRDKKKYSVLDYRFKTNKPFDTAEMDIT